MNSVLTDINEKIETQLKSISGMVYFQTRGSRDRMNRNDTAMT